MASPSILTLVGDPVPQILTTLYAVRRELGVSDAASDDFINDEIPRASTAICNACGRKLIAQNYSEQWRRNAFSPFTSVGVFLPGLDALRLRQYPATITGIVENGVTLDPAADFESDPSSGMVWRLANDCRVRWTAAKIVVTYTGGYDSTNADHAADLSVLERAAISMIKLNYFARGRDPSLRSENVLSGLYAYTLFDPATPDGAGPYADAERWLAPYRKVDR